MASGTFDKTVGKVRPGTYINFTDTSETVISGAERGTVIIPLANTDYGPAGSFISISADALDGAKTYLGYSVYDTDPANNMLLIREALKGAQTVIVYICTEGSKAATGTGGGLTATAKYKGARGNNLSFLVAENLLSGYDVEVYLDDSRVEKFEGISDVSEIDSSWVTFTSSGDLAEIAAVSLTGGTSSVTTNSDITDFLDKAESVRWNAMAFPFEDSTLCAALKTKITYMRDKMGRGVQAVAPKFYADYEGIINVTNSYELEDGELTTAQATAFVAGITAGAKNIDSNGYKQVDGAIAVVGLKTHEESIVAINAGEFFFTTSESGTVIVEYDINSFVTFISTKGKMYRKNRVIRTLDGFAESLQLNFPPNKFNNNSTDWAVMEGLGRTILKQHEDAGAIKDVDYDTDFKVDTELSAGDETYFNVGIQPVDSAEKLYFSVETR